MHQSRYSYYSAISDRTHWPLGPTTTKYTYSWASSYVRNLWQSYTSGKGTGQAKAVLDYYGGLMVVDAIGKVLYTSCDSYYSTCEPGHLDVDDFVTALGKWRTQQRPMAIDPRDADDAAQLCAA